MSKILAVARYDYVFLPCLLEEISYAICITYFPTIPYGFDWYKHDGQYSKGKIHCGCGLCKFGKKYGLPTVKCMREHSRERILMKDLESDLYNVD